MLQTYGFYFIIIKNVSPYYFVSISYTHVDNLEMAFSPIPCFLIFIVLLFQYLRKHVILGSCFFQHHVLKFDEDLVLVVICTHCTLIF